MSSCNKRLQGCNSRCYINDHTFGFLVFILNISKVGALEEALEERERSLKLKEMEISKFETHR